MMSDSDCKIGVIIFISFAPFLFTLDGDFVFDDSEAIANNADVTSNDTISIFYNDYWGNNIRSNSSHKSYRPLTILTFRLNYFLSDDQLIPVHFKVTNLALHCVCCILIFLTYQALLDGASSKTIDVAFYAALLFAVHPVHVEAVSGIVGRADILAAISFFAALLFYIQSVHDTGTQSYLYMAYAIGCAATSMLCKENGITVLGVCFVYEILYRKHDEQDKNQREKKSQNILSMSISPMIKVSLIRLFILSLSLIVLLLARWMIMGGTGPKFQEVDNPAAFAQDLFTKIASYNYIYLLNLLLFFWPQWLCFDWSMGCVPLITSLTDSRMPCLSWMYGYGIITVRFLIDETVRGRRIVIMALAIMILPFIPASNLLFPVGFVIAERVLYIPSAGYCLMVVLGIRKIIDLDRIKYYKPVSIAFYLLLVLYDIRTCQRSMEWAEEFSLFTSALRVCPNNAKVHYNVAKVADARNHTQWAIAEYEEAIRLYPEYYQAMNNLGNLMKTQKRYTEAVTLLKTAIYYKKDFPPAWMNLGIVLAQLGQHEQALSAYSTALLYRKNYPDCYYNMGNLYLEMQMHDNAADAWLEAIKLNPKHQTAWTNFLALLDNTGQSDKALVFMPRALDHLPHSPSITFILANIYGKMNNFHSAEKYFKKAIALFDDRVQPIHFSNLGVLYHRWKKFKLAEEMYKKALILDPNFESAQNNLLALQSINYRDT